MWKRVTFLVLSTTLLLSAAEREKQHVIHSGFKCPISGCTLECSIDGNKPIKISGIRHISMSAYRHIGTFYELDLGMHEKRTVIVDGEAVLCQIINHK